jgi:hypothetical protein
MECCPPTHVLFLLVICRAHNEYIVVMALSPVVDLALCTEESRVYLGYHLQNEGKCLRVFPGVCYLEKQLFDLF